MRRSVRALVSTFLVIIDKQLPSIVKKPGQEERTISPTLTILFFLEPIERIHPLNRIRALRAKLALQKDGRKEAVRQAFPKKTCFACRKHPQLPQHQFGESF